MKIRSKLFWLLIVLAITYALVNLIAAPPRTALMHYGISTATLRIINFSVVGPVILVWFVGLYGFQKLRDYTAYITGNKDGQQLVYLSRGTFFLTLWLPVSSTSSSVLSLIGQHITRLQPAIAIVVAYTGLLLPLIAFFYISRGARGLSELVKQRPAWKAMNILSLLLILLGVMYAYLITRSQATLGMIYHMPTILVMVTIVVPYIFAWYLGLFAAYELHLYTYKVKGVIYRQSWNALALGVSWIILFSVILQYITVVTAKFTNLPLGGLLALIYGVIAILAIGYLFIAQGAQKLTKIEEV